MARLRTVTIADDHPVVLGGLSSIIEASGRYRVVGRAANGPAALADINQHCPTVAIVDFRMPSLDALGILRQLDRQAMTTRILVLTGLLADSEIHALAAAGADGILFKDAATTTLLDVLDHVAAGGSWLDHEPVAAAIRNGRSSQSRWAALAPTLTGRERELVALAQIGRSNKEIAGALNVSEGTVKVHFHNIFRKFGVGTRGELLAIVSHVDVPQPGS